MADPKVDIFWLLSQIDKKNYDVWGDLNEEQRKSITPYVVTMWMAGCDDFEQLEKLGFIAAPCVFDFSNKPELMLKVLTACSTNGSKRYEWCAPKNEKKFNRAIQLVASSYKMSLSHASDVISLFSWDDIEELAKYQGYQQDEIKELKKEYK
jgi:hypothetical protein